MVSNTSSPGCGVGVSLMLFFYKIKGIVLLHLLLANIHCRKVFLCYVTYAVDYQDKHMNEFQTAFKYVNIKPKIIEVIGKSIKYFLIYSL